jgi:ATP/maltotriose-dependent transcriptional regulator MalT
VQTLADSVASSEESFALARQSGKRSAETFALLALGSCLGPMGEFGRALEALDAGLAIAQDIAHQQWQCAHHYMLARLHLDLGNLTVARDHAESAYMLAQALGSIFWLYNTAGTLTSACATQCDFQRADVILANHPVSESTVITSERMLAVARAEVALARGDAAHAIALTETLIAADAAYAPAVGIPRLHHLLGLALMRLDRLAEAEHALLLACRTAQNLGAFVRVRQAQTALVRLYRRQKRYDAAERVLAELHPIIQRQAATLPEGELRATVLAQALNELPAERPPTPSKATKLQYGGLTARERDVARLIAAGLSNRAIAEKLTLGERTIETHVSHILGKLGCATRAQIAVWADQHGLATPGQA